MLPLLKLKLIEVLKDVAPLVGTVCLLQVLLVHAPLGLFLRFLTGSALAALGMMLLFAGIDLGVLPMGRYIGAELPRRGSMRFIVAVAFGLGFAVTVAEPDVLILSEQVQRASDGTLGGASLVAIIAAGVGLFTAVGFIRIVRGFSMAWLLTLMYSAILGLSFLAPADLVPLAYDSGSVTTGVLTAPVVLALALGLSSVLARRSAVSDGFGLLGLASAGPVLAVLLFGWLR
jgi:Protein of unknown function (DUF1538)